MIITYIELVGNIRLSLNDKRVFKMDMSAREQMVLGSNGSGKSSLLQELSPLPANKDDYEKGGAKTIHLTHDRHYYELNSDFSNGQHHSFLKDNEELNPGGTVTVQKELVKKEFGITQEIRDLLIGKVKFTEMSPAKRREWFMVLSPITYEYAIEVHEKLKIQHRDTVGSIKRLKTRLVSEAAKVVSNEQQAQLQVEVDQIHHELDFLREIRKPVELDSHQLHHQYDQALHELQGLNDKLIRLRVVAPYTAYGEDEFSQRLRNEWGELEPPHFSSVEHIAQFIEQIRMKIVAEDTFINVAMKDHKKLKDNQEVLRRAGLEGVKALGKKVDILSTEYREILQRRKLAIDDLEPEAALQSLSAVRESLTDVFTSIPDNEDKRFSQAALKGITDQLEHAKSRATALDENVRALVSEHTHVQSHAANTRLSCPSCGHGFVPGFDEARLKDLQAGIEAAHTRYREAVEHVRVLEERLSEYLEYGRLYRQYTSCVRNFPHLGGFWRYLEQEAIVTDRPRMGHDLIATLEHDLRLGRDAARVLKSIGETQDLIEQSAQVGDSNLAEIELKIQEKEVEIEGLTVRLGVLRRLERDYQTYRRQLVESFQLTQQIDTMVKELDGINDEMLETLRRETLNHCIRQLSSALSKKEETLDGITRQRELVKSLEQEIDQETVREQAAKLLVQTLSPTDGLIAEGLLSFIKVYVREMNTLMRKIWTYPLVIHNCGINTEQGAELDYKFPLMVHQKHNVKKDVSLGSTGMQEIINLAFVVSAMHYLGLDQMPLYLDEFGHSFDKAHRVNAAQCIKSLMDQKPFSQLYMISHYQASYGAFTQAEVCVLDQSNIELAQGMQVNQHVVFQ